MKVLLLLAGIVLLPCALAMQNPAGISPAIQKMLDEAGKLKDQEAALAAYKKILLAAKREKDPRGMAEAEIDIGRKLIALKKWKDAAGHYEGAVKAFQELRDTKNQ